MRVALLALRNAHEHFFGGVFSAQPSAIPPRAPFFPITNYTYSSLLPRLEVCHTADRTCPSFLEGNFPVPQFNGDANRGVGFTEGSEPGVVGCRTTDKARNSWNTSWYNDGS